MLEFQKYSFIKLKRCTVCAYLGDNSEKFSRVIKINYLLFLEKANLIHNFIETFLLIYMRKIIIAGMLLLSSMSAFTANLPDRYIGDIEKISTQYNSDMKSFLKSLNPQLTQFNVQQQAQFCGIVKQYVDAMYTLTDQNRQYLPLSSQSTTKQNIIDQVMLSPEMQILKKYDIQCDLK